MAGGEGLANITSIYSKIFFNIFIFSKSTVIYKN